MAKNLLIVESPAKAKTIEKYLGPDFQVEASMGHIRDLPKGDKAIDVGAGFEPSYEVSPDKTEIVSKLRKLAKKAEKVWLATDEDREGEAISWHLAEALDLDLETTPRIVFNEITKPAILRAIQEPRVLDMDLVYAQQARRVLDRLVGFELSPILWKKVRTGLSAGRVQSVAVRLIVEREREVLHFAPEPFFQVVGQLLSAQGKPFTAKQPKHLATVAEARAWLEAAQGASWAVADTKVKPGKRTPAAPFTTSTLQQEAARKLGYSVAQTMRVAQQLYEAGYISYMRTDSVNLSETALQGAQAAITAAFGERYHQRRTYRSKTANAQEAHEAIRPTDLARQEVPGERQSQRLYELIWKRTLASQMADAQLERTTVTLNATPATPVAPALAGLLNLQAQGEVILFDGFLKLYLEGTDEGDDEGGDTEGLLPQLRVGDSVTAQRLTATERYTRPPARYTEASLVKRL
ncbi:MAG: type I DNA topoisomerase, partial [Bacteroidia bacterium]|nr:type I DNA topoisomerase [Bacteroidia bacterium]